jgi:hypothetical protein
MRLITLAIISALTFAPVAAVAAVTVAPAASAQQIAGGSPDDMIYF